MKIVKKTDRMTSADRNDLVRLLRARVRVVKNEIAAAQAVQLSEVERQLAATYSAYDEAWAEITKDLEKMAAEADKKIAAKCRAMGIPENFRPEIDVTWYGRGENANAKRRAELRRVAETTLEARAKAARVEVDRTEADLLSKIILAGLRSAEARLFLESLPTVEKLLPKLSLDELERKVPMLEP
jgi:hypothetical protein